MPKGEVEFGQEEWEKRADRMIEHFDKHIMPQTPVASTDSTEVTKQRYTWKIMSVRCDDLKRYGLDAADAPEQCVKKYADGVKYDIIRHEDWDEWQYDIGQQPGKMEWGVFHRDIPAVKPDSKIYFNHLPEGYREFRNAREARAYIRRHHPDNDLNL